MSAARSAAKRRAKGGKLLPAICNLLGTLLLLAVILTYLPLSAPRLFGVEAFHVESASMSPAIPQGSVVFIRPAEAAELAPGDVVAFKAEDAVVVHRVVQNRVVEGELVTKGDANPTEDPTPTPYSAVVGRMGWHLPVLGGLLALYATPVGKLYALLLAGSGVMFHLLAGILRARRSAALREDLEAELTAPAQESPARRTRSVRPRRRKKGKTILVIVLLLAFVGSGAAILWLTGRYRKAEKLYDAAAAQYAASAQTQPTALPEPSETPTEETTAQPTFTAPITVDFAALQAINPDVVGWIYCEGTPISYPLLHGATNDSYLRTAYDGSYSYAGSIFLAAENAPDFSDGNTILYGHNLKDGSMFACLEDWADEAFFAAHPVLWILTPTQDYRVELFAGYLTDAYDDVYRTDLPNGQEQAEYIARAQAKSDVRPRVTLPQDAKLVLLSTCAYDFETARYVLHGALEPAAATGGTP